MVTQEMACRATGTHCVHGPIDGLLNLPLNDARKDVQQGLVQPVSRVAVDGQVEGAKANG